jgi:acetyl-CoA C-acetyltransferase
MEKNPVVFVGATRTPQGNLLGELKDFSSHQLGSIVIQKLLEKTMLTPADIQEVILGCVLTAGQGQAPARQAALNAGLSSHVSCTTINKMCGSGMKAIMLSHDILLANPSHIMIAGGMESMSQAPYLTLKARQGYRFGHDQYVDHALYDGLEDAYDKGRPMGYFAEQCAAAFGFTRKEQDLYAISSFERARKAIQNKWFAEEIIAIKQSGKNGIRTIDTDERPFSVDLERIANLSPAFVKEGTVTAGNSSSLSDGAAAVLVMRMSEAEKRGITPLARIIGCASFAKTPAQFTTAPIDVIQQLLNKLGWQSAQVDLFEINEAFAVIAMAAMRELQIPHEKINIHGGGCALGHPIGATGARIIVTLISALRQHNLKRGIAALCIGGGEATAIAIEVI